MQQSNATPLPSVKPDYRTRQPKSHYEKTETLPLPEPTIVPGLAMPVGERLTLQDLTENTCRWPIGTPGEHDFHFCGHQSKANKPYCKAHVGIAYQPAKSQQAANNTAQRQSRAAYG